MGKFAVPPCTSGSCSNQDEDGLKAALATYGPLSICINAAWQTYHDGVLSTACSADYWDLDHCVQLVGYDTTASTPYWKVRNSWGPSWGVANEAMYVTASLSAAVV